MYWYKNVRESKIIYTTKHKKIHGRKNRAQART
jgi:hypothetical protein